MARTSSNQKLNNSGDMPKIIDISGQPEAVARYGGIKMLIAAPMQYNALMARVPEGKVVTSDQLRAYLAKNAGADFTCPLTAGIFINICARASVERNTDNIPYWRTLKSKGELNEKYPEGVEGQKLRLEAEGFEVIQKGKRYFLKDYERFLWQVA
jgi:alkylated DNA nucleotide flippase Atl1